jgi:putative heme-binding domain-containing protein
MLVIFAALLLAQATDPLAGLTSDDLARGKKLYESWCALCHGQTGGGGKGSRLAQPKLRHASDNAELVKTIQQGVEGSEMPAFWMLGDKEAAQVAGYVRSLGTLPAEPVPGDPQRGSALYTKAGCAACHIVNGAGSSLGPELSDIGARRSAAYIRESLINPAAQVPEDFFMVRAVTRDGKEIRAMLVSEDSFTIQLRDLQNRFHSLRKLDLREFKKDARQSPMPAANISGADLDNLIAYLANLRGDK